MGGSGSGRYGYRPIVENGIRLSVYYFQRNGLLNRGSGNIYWKHGDTDEHFASLSYRSEIGYEQVWLEYTVTVGGEKYNVNEAIQLTTTKVTFGLRYWWICPRCRGRCGMLYLPSGEIYFRCRKCYRLTYQSSNDSGKFDRIFASIAVSTGVPFNEVKSILRKLN